MRLPLRWVAAIPPRQNKGMMTMIFAEALDRYGREVSARKLGARSEFYRLGTIRKSPIASLPLAEVTPEAVAQYRDDRAAEVSASSVRSELSLIRRTLEEARLSWGFALPVNSASAVTPPPPGPERTRRVSDRELSGLLAELESSPVAKALVSFALHTALPRRELLSLHWGQIDCSAGLLAVPASANRPGRHVPLTDEALAILEGLEGREGPVFPIDACALRWAWGQACTRAGIHNLRFQDLRHEGCLRLFEAGLSVPEVAAMTGYAIPP
jgi:integrase